MEWDELAQVAEQRFNNNKWIDAEYFYHQAISEIEAVWLENLSAKKGPDSVLLKAWIESLHKLSEIYKSRGDNKKAVHFLMLPHNWLLSMVEKPDIGPDLKLFVLNALNLTLPTLLALIEDDQEEICQHCKISLMETKQWLDTQTPILH